MVRVRDSPFCAICEFVMKELEARLEDQATEVRYVLTDVSNTDKILLVSVQTLMPS